jgi:hypothetical protein
MPAMAEAGAVFRPLIARPAWGGGNLYLAAGCGYTSQPDNRLESPR